MESTSSMVDDLDHFRRKINRLNKLVEAPKADVVYDAATFARLEKGLHERDELITQLLKQNEQLQSRQEDLQE